VLELKTHDGSVQVIIILSVVKSTENLVEELPVSSSTIYLVGKQSGLTGIIFYIMRFGLIFDNFSFVLCISKELKIVFDILLCLSDHDDYNSYALLNEAIKAINFRLLEQKKINLTMFFLFQK
jgi:hypothetical protein